MSPIGASVSSPTLHGAGFILSDITEAQTPRLGPRMHAGGSGVTSHVWSPQPRLPPHPWASGLWCSFANCRRPGKVQDPCVPSEGLRMAPRGETGRDAFGRAGLLADFSATLNSIYTQQGKKLCSRFFSQLLGTPGVQHPSRRELLLFRPHFCPPGAGWGVGVPYAIWAVELRGAWQRAPEAPAELASLCSLTW